MTTQTLGRSRHLRLNPMQDDALQRIARQEGCSVSDLLRRAAIQMFSLPIDATDGGDETQDASQSAPVPSGETPTSEVAS
jgi:hypothetical protein